MKRENGQSSPGNARDVRATASPVEHVFGHEVLQRSGLRRYSWPDRDPESVEQSTRTLCSDDHERIRQAATNLPCSAAGLLERSAHLPTAKRVLFLLSHGVFNFNSVPGVRNESKWLERIQSAVRAGAPVPVLYPLFCKIGNWAKQMTATGATAGEESILYFLEYLHELVRQVYSPGLSFEILADAHLYNTALQNTPAEAAHYLASIRELAGRLRTSGVIRIHDYAELLASESRPFRRYYGEYYPRLLRGTCDLVSEQTRQALFDSLMASINTRRLGLSYEEHCLVFSSKADPRHPTYRQVHGMAHSALADQLAIKLAADRLNLPELLWPTGIRVSCHKGLKHGRHVIGLRVYPTYYRCTRLLPYHGMALLTRDRRGGPKLDVLPEILLRGRTDLTRIVNEHGEAYAYAINTDLTDTPLQVLPFPARVNTAKAA